MAFKLYTRPRKLCLPEHSQELLDRLLRAQIATYRLSGKDRGRIHRLEFDEEDPDAEPQLDVSLLSTMELCSDAIAAVVIGWLTARRPPHAEQVAELKRCAVWEMGAVKRWQPELHGYPLYLAWLVSVERLRTTALHVGEAALAGPGASVPK